MRNLYIIHYLKLYKHQENRLTGPILPKPSLKPLILHNDIRYDNDNDQRHRSTTSILKITKFIYLYHHWFLYVRNVLIYLKYSRIYTKLNSRNLY